MTSDLFLTIAEGFSEINDLPFPTTLLDSSQEFELLAGTLCACIEWYLLSSGQLKPDKVHILLKTLDELEAKRSLIPRDGTAYFDRLSEIVYLVRDQIVVSNE